MKKRWVLSDKERLEMIKGIQKRIKECQEKGQNVSNLHSDYVDWLIEQAEKKEYWRNQHRKRTDELEEAYFKIQLLENKLERYEKVLKEIQELSSYYIDDASMHGIAKQVLEEELPNG